MFTIEIRRRVDLTQSQVAAITGEASYEPYSQLFLSATAGALAVNTDALSAGDSLAYITAVALPNGTDVRLRPNGEGGYVPTK